MKYLSKFVLLTVSLTLLFSIPILAQEKSAKITLEEYQTLIKQWQDREAAALNAIAIEDSIIKELKEKYRLTEEEIAKIQQEIFNLLGVYEADVANYNNEVAALENQINTLRALTPELLFQRQNELKSVEEKVISLKNESLSNVPENLNRLNNISSDVEDLRNKVPVAQKPRNDSYTVVKGDNLWKISAKPDIYNDPFKWPRIWSANADIIKNPNLIYAEQVLVIIRQLESNQRLVVKGDNLRDIAASPEVYNDPFAWTKIYEANKNQIKDPNLIYPEQILTIPGK